MKPFLRRAAGARPCLIALTLGLVVVVGAAAFTPASAQQVTPQRGMRGQNASQYSDAKLAAFARAMATIQARMGDMNQIISSARDPGQAQATQNVYGMMAEVVEQTPGITFQEFNTITQHMMQDQMLLMRIQQQFMQLSAQ